jgi:hypothetical protein
MATFERRKTRKPGPKPDNIPKVWAEFLGDIAEIWGDKSPQLARARVHEPAVMAAVAGRTDCYLYPYHTHPVVYRKPSYRADVVNYQIRVSEVSYKSDASANDKAILTYNAVEDYVRSLIVYPNVAGSPAKFEELMDLKPDLIGCLKMAIDVVAGDAIEAENVKFEAPSPMPAKTR